MDQVGTYVIAYETELWTLESTVNRFVRDGWMPTGGAFATQLRGDSFYYGQALVHPERYKTKPE
jgi:hypothetical protein